MTFFDPSAGESVSGEEQRSQNTVGLTSGTLFGDFETGIVANRGWRHW